MTNNLVDVIVAKYKHSVPKKALLEQINASDGLVFSLYMDAVEGAFGFQLLTSLAGVAQTPINVTNLSMAAAVTHGQPFIHFLLAQLNETSSLNQITGCELSTDSPGVMGGSLKSDWGTLSLLLPQDSCGYELETRISRPKQPRVKERFPIDHRVVAQAVEAGDMPLFAALRSSPAAAALLAQHDDFLRSVIEADSLAQASMPPAEGYAPARRPKTL